MRFIEYILAAILGSNAIAPAETPAARRPELLLPMQ
jgi:hypothetical protein